MAVKASATITVSFMIDVVATYRYYKLQSSIVNPPSAPSVHPPSAGSGWTDAEPTYTEGSTNTLYTVDATIFSNGEFLYSAVSKSTSYEAAKTAYNKAVSAESTANSAQSTVNNMEIGGRNLFRETPRSYSPTSYSAYTINLSENLVVGNTYTIQLWDVDVSHTGKSATQLGVFVYHGAGYIQLCSWVGDKFTNGHADYLSATFVSRSGTGSENSWIVLYNSVPSASGTMNMSVGKWKLEKGNKPTDWTPAPEDVDYAINEKANSAALEDLVSEYAEFVQTTNSFKASVNETVTSNSGRITASESSISQLANNISNLIVDENGTSLVEQTPAGWKWSTKKLDDLADSVPTSINDLSTNISNVNNTLSQSINSVKTTADAVSNNVNTYMSFSNNGLSLGKENSSMAVNITNDRISFKDNGSEVAYINGQMLYIENEQILKNLRFGNFVFFERQGSDYNNDGSHNMGLKWIN